jgi:hypothetical protein
VDSLLFVLQNKKGNYIRNKKRITAANMRLGESLQRVGLADK